MDLVVVVPGIMGSRLADADGRPVWDLKGRALSRAISTLGGSLKALALPGGLGDGHPGDGIRPTGLMPDVHVIPGFWHPVDGYTDLMAWLAGTFGLTPGETLLDFPYDWRLSCRYNAALLKRRVEEGLERLRAASPEHADARVILLCHSMGGLIARHYVERLGGRETTRRVITLGTPHRGSVDALTNLVNGLRKGWGPLRPDLTALARSLPSLHQLTPDYACVRTPGGLVHPADLPGLPGPDPELLADAARFHADLRAAAPAEGLVCLVGIRQPTAAVAEFTGGLLVTEAESGDGTVPRLAARPADADRTGYAVAEGHTPCEQHGSLHNNRGVRDALYGLLDREPPFRRDGERTAPALGVGAPPLAESGEPYEVRVRADGHEDLLLTAELRPADGGPSRSRSLANLGGGQYRTVFPTPSPGAHRLIVHAVGHPGSAVTALTVVSEE
ncbi:hypothetical protein ACFYZ4_07095 [Streptomyces sp. NPDC001513]|uniref:lipase/acyltransferase domain-containing protein n=1 Tax=Streptomyces sp. NPDC001513 TaxID=3364580 RepID=UPI0036B5CEEB